MEISKKMDNAIIMKIAKKKLVSVMFQYRSTAAVSVATRGEATKRIHILIIGAFRYSLRDRYARSLCVNLI